MTFFAPWQEVEDDDESDIDSEDDMPDLDDEGGKCLVHSTGAAVQVITVTYNVSWYRGRR